MVAVSACVRGFACLSTLLAYSTDYAPKNIWFDDVD